MKRVFYESITETAKRNKDLHYVKDGHKEFLVDISIIKDKYFDKMFFKEFAIQLRTLDVKNQSIYISCENDKVSIGSGMNFIPYIVRVGDSGKTYKLYYLNDMFYTMLDKKNTDSECEFSLIIGEGSTDGYEARYIFV